MYAADVEVGEFGRLVATAIEGGWTLRSAASIALAVTHSEDHVPFYDDVLDPSDLADGFSIVG